MLSRSKPATIFTFTVPGGYPKDLDRQLDRQASAFKLVILRVDLGSCDMHTCMHDKRFPFIEFRVKQHCICSSCEGQTWTMQCGLGSSPFDAGPQPATNERAHHDLGLCDGARAVATHQSRLCGHSTSLSLAQGAVGCWSFKIFIDHWQNPSGTHGHSAILVRGAVAVHAPKRCDVETIAGAPCATQICSNSYHRFRERHSWSMRRV